MTARNKHIQRKRMLSIIIYETNYGRSILAVDAILDAVNLEVQEMSSLYCTAEYMVTHTRCVN